MAGCNGEEPARSGVGKAVTRAFEQCLSAVPKSTATADIQRDIVIAACSLPVKVSGEPLILFGMCMNGDGWLFNPKYWIVEYILVQKNGRTMTFTSSESQPSAWNQTTAFLEKNVDWHGSTLNVHVEVGSLGASAAINDVWNPTSAMSYAIDCLGAATLVQFRGLCLWYHEASRDAVFEQTYSSFGMDWFGDTSRLPASTIDKDFEITVLDKSIVLLDAAGIAKTLRVGDQVPITNPFASGAWATENTIYIGDDKFFGHPFGCITRQQYAEKLASQMGAQKPLEERVQQVLQQSYIISYSRPRTPAATKSVAGPPVK
jgi:hypothetical protein